MQPVAGKEAKPEVGIIVLLGDFLDNNTLYENCWESIPRTIMIFFLMENYMFFKEIIVIV